MAAQEILTISAVYEDGVLPLEPLDLPERTRVQLTVAVTDDGTAEISDEELRSILAIVGLELVHMPTDGLLPMTEEAQEALFREIRPGFNLSEAIIEERESGW